MIAHRHPARERPWAALLVSLLVAALGTLLWQCLAPFTALALLSVLLVNLIDFYLPSRYELSLEQLKIRRGPWTIVHSWSRFQSFRRDRNGIILSTFAQPHPLDVYRSTFLPLTPGQREEAFEWLNSHLKPST